MKELPMIPFIDLKSQYEAIKPQIQKRIQNVLEHGAYVNGPEVAELEAQLAQFTGTKFALTCASGTDALLIPMMALGIKPGDEVITTAFSFIATAETICLMGATPIYVDIDPKTFNIDPQAVEAAITPKTRAILPVSLYGQMADMDRLKALADKYNLFLIEDLAQSFGATYKGKRSGSIGHVSGTSFFPAKPLGCYGDGGAIFTNDEHLYKVMKEIREHGSERRYYHTRLGINGRLDTIQCAILLAKLERYPKEIEMRQAVAKRYEEAFKSIKMADFSYPYVEPHNTSVWAQYSLTVPNRDEFQKKMTDRGIPTSVHYPMIMPDQPWYADRVERRLDWSQARWAAAHVVSLPMYPDMTQDIQNKIIEAVKQSL
jgi:UDP-2-acetamido-2-deoxy-ribo-hexuluronate aminotransferase